MSAETSASRPTDERDLARPGAPRPPGRRRRRLPAGRRSSASSLTARSGRGHRRRRRPTRRRADRRCRASTEVAQARSEMASGAAGHRRSRAASIEPDEVDGSSVSAHGARANRSSASGTRGASRAGTTRTGSPVHGQHQHGQPLERHGPVPGQPGQVGAVGQEQGVDPELVHPLPAPGRAGADARAPRPVRECGHGRSSGGGRRRPRRARRRSVTPAIAVSSALGRLPGVVARPGQGRRLDVGEAHGLPASRRPSNSSGVHHRATGRWPRARAQVLAERHDVDPDRPQVGQGGQHLVLAARPCRGSSPTWW